MTITITPAPEGVPTWIHDCIKCEFLGAAIVQGEKLDCYVCGNSYVARYGDECPEYYSGSYKNRELIGGMETAIAHTLRLCRDMRVFIDRK